MDGDKNEALRARAYALWEQEGRPHGRQHVHWLQAMQELGLTVANGEASDAHPGMMGDGTEEQNLDQTGNPSARVTQADVDTAFADKTAK